MKLVSLILVLIVSACGKSKSSSNTTSDQPKESQQAEALTGKTLDEVLKLKYKSVSVDCELRLQESEAVDLSRNPEHRFGWKFPEDKEAVRTVVVKFGQLEGTVTYNLPIILLVDSLSHTNAKGEEYHLEFTPKVIVYSSRLLKYVSLPDLTMVHRGYEMNLVENMGLFSKTKVLTETGSPHLLDLRCALNTVMRPEYEDQFKQIK